MVCLLLAAACGGGGNSGDDTHAGDAGADATKLPDDGPCTPNATRCNVNTPETCAADGSHWVPGTECATFCQEGTCALAGLDVASDMTLEGTIVVSGAVTVHSGATLSSATGNLTIFADSISVENGGSIAAAATGSDAADAGQSTTSNFQAGGGQNSSSATDSTVKPGGPGGTTGFQTTPVPGGGVLRLIAKTSITMAGQVTADGVNGLPSTSCGYGGGGGGGGGILMITDVLTVSGSVSAAGGFGGPGTGNTSCSAEISNPGQPGVVKLLHGSMGNITGTVVGTKTVGLAPPLPVTSTSHPDETAIYNDNFISLDVGWGKAFPSVMGYYVIIDQSPANPPTAATGMFLGVNKVSFPSSMVLNGDNYVHVVSVDSQSAISTVETVFHVAINTRGPSMSSSSHPNQTQFLPNTNPFFSWTYPQGDAQVSGSYYVFDHFGKTIPAVTDTHLPAGQKQLQQTNVDAGIWVLHVVAADSQGRLTKAAGHYRVNIGSVDPGEGFVMGLVEDSTHAPQVSATVSLNRGLFETTTSSTGNYTLSGVPAGTYELSATLGTKTATKMITVAATVTTTGNIQIQ